MSTRYYGPATPLLIGYDPSVDLPQDHLARFVDKVVEAAVPPGSRKPKRGRPAYDLRLCLKVLIFGYATGVRSSRVLERLCHEHLAYLFLTRGDAPCYRTLCTVRTKHQDLLEQIWLSLFAIAGQHGIARLGRITIDSSKFRANASGEAIVTSDEYEPMLAELERILAEAKQADEQEDEGGSSGTRLGQVVDAGNVATDQMRDILRRVRLRQAQQKKGQEPPPPEPTRLTQRMRQRAEQAVDAIQEAVKDKRKHLCLTDPDARMMPEGSQKLIKECHSLEVAVDAGLIVAGQSTQDGCDQQRLASLVEAALAQEPGGVVAVDADSGYYSSDTVASLIASGIDTCIPDVHTACDLHRGASIGTTRARVYGRVPFTYDPEQDRYTCPEGNVLQFGWTRKRDGQTSRVYLAVRDCTGCPLAAQCIRQKDAKRRHYYVGDNHEALEQARRRFEQAEHQARYHQRGPAIETIFGFLRSTLGYIRWLLRGKEKVACEAELFKLAYQVRKIGSAWQKSQRALA